MARSVQEIFDGMIAEKESKATLGSLLPIGTDFNDLLNDVTSQSKVADWRLWIYIHSFGIFIVESLWDTFKAEVIVIKNQSIFGTELWWIDRINEFQFGFNVEVLESEGQYNIGYANIDEASQIVAASAIFSNELGESVIKVAKESGGALVAFDSSEIISINAYRDAIQPAGSNIDVISLNADLIFLTADIHYNALFDLAAVTTEVEDTIKAYYNNLDFGGVVVVNSIIDKLQALDSVKDVLVVKMDAKPQGGVFATFPRVYDSSAGYVKEDPANPLTGTLTFIPA